MIGITRLYANRLDRDQGLRHVAEVSCGTVFQVRLPQSSSVRDARIRGLLNQVADLWVG